VLAKEQDGQSYSELEQAFFRTPEYNIVHSPRCASPSQGLHEYWILKVKTYNKLTTMGLGDEYSRDALFRRPDQEINNSDSDCEESPEPLHPEDFEALYSDEIYTDVVIIQEFVNDNYYRIKHRYGVVEYTQLLHDAERFWSDCTIRMDIMRLHRRLHHKDMFDPQSFQNWLQYYIELE